MQTNNSPRPARARAVALPLPSPSIAERLTAELQLWKNSAVELHDRMKVPANWAEPLAYTAGLTLAVPAAIGGTMALITGTPFWPTVAQASLAIPMNLGRAVGLL